MLNVLFISSGLPQNLWGCYYYSKREQQKNLSVQKEINKKLSLLVKGVTNKKKLLRKGAIESCVCSVFVVS